MFSLFKKSNRPEEPLDKDTRKYFEHNMLWLNQEFPEPALEERNIFTPDTKDFLISWDGSEETAHQVMKLISENMQIAYVDILLEFFDNPTKEINMGTSTLFLEDDHESPEAAGTYRKTQDGKYEIALDKVILNDPENLIATIAHELSHIKLLGEKELEQNDELLTDLTTVFFGFGVFNANTAFRFYKNYDRWGYRNMGYLKQEEWAYALALLAFMRYEESPEWAKFLNPSIKKDFEKSLSYMLRNEQEIFHFDDEENNT